MKMKNTTKNKPNSKQKEKKQNVKLINKTKLIRNINYGSFFLFILVAFYFLPVHNYNVLIKMQELSLFLPTELFFTDTLQSLGGLLSYLGCFLTQFFFYPWVGGSIFVLLLLLVHLLIYKSFNLPKKYYPLTLIPSFAILLVFTKLGYVIFLPNLQGYAFLDVLGIILVLTAFAGYKKLSSWIIRLVYISLLVLLLYPLFGFYALFGALLIIVYEVISFQTDKNKKSLIKAFVGIVLILLVPYAYYRYYYTNLVFTDIYTSGLPIKYLFDFKYGLWLPYAVLFVSLIVLPLVSLKKFKTETKFSTIISVVGIYVLCIVGLNQFSFEDENFKTEIAMDLAIFNNDWDEVLTLSKNLKGEPTRLIVMDTNLALQKLHIAGDKMFTYKNGSKPFNTTFSTPTMRIGAKPLYFNYGKFNYCYRWCMEEMVANGMTVEELKYMVKCSLMNNEFALAAKYNDVLKKTLFHKVWALKYQQFIEHPQLMNEDPEFKTVNSFRAYDDKVESDEGLLEMYLLNSFAYLQTGNLEQVELSLQCTMILRNTKLFWPRFFLYAQTHDRIPVHYQEAAILYATLDGNVDIHVLKLDPAVIDNFKRFLKMNNQNAYNSIEKNRIIFEPEFGQTFWYYFMFMKNWKAS
jgi:hypothetical protein